jgi:hypothetical protein
MIIRFFIISTFFLLISTLQAESDKADCRVAQSAIAKASSIRELKIKSPVPCLMQNQDQIKQFLIHAVHHKVPAEKMRYDELVAKAVGFIPEDYDYKNGLINLYLSQLGGYYDPEKKRYVMAGWLPQVMQPTVAVHELTHALQDQYFNLNTFIDDKNFYTDKLLARAALVEGDATAVMLDYQRGLMGQPSLAQVEKVDSFILQSVLGMALSTAQAGVPESLKAALLFPYASGTRFAHFLLRKGGYKELTKAFSNPPDTTEEILHPEIYQTSQKGYRIVEDKEFNIKPEEILYRDSLGEFSISALLSGGEIKKELAAGVASGWGGDLVIVYGEKEKESLQWKIIWDSKADAQEFFNSYKEFLVARGSAVKQSDINQVEVKVDSRVIRLGIDINKIETLLASDLSLKW